jgi:hypothetical protein
LRAEIPVTVSENEVTVFYRSANVPATAYATIALESADGGTVFAGEKAFPPSGKQSVSIKGVYSGKYVVRVNIMQRENARKDDVRMTPPAELLVTGVSEPFTIEKYVAFPGDPCASDDECKNEDGNLLCVDGSCEENVDYIPPIGQICTTNNDCKSAGVGLPCIDGVCSIAVCDRSLNCQERFGVRFVCFDNKCIQGPNLEYYCEVNSDCRNGEYCALSRCVPAQCTSNMDCKAESDMIQGTCSRGRCQYCSDDCGSRMGVERADGLPDAIDAGKDYCSTSGVRYQCGNFDSDICLDLKKIDYCENNGEERCSSECAYLARVNKDWLKTCNTFEQSCSGCRQCGIACTQNTDCRNEQQCIAGKCAIVNCNNGVRDGDEKGIDCGGSCKACTVMPNLQIEGIIVEQVYMDSTDKIAEMEEEFGVDATAKYRILKVYVQLKGVDALKESEFGMQMVNVQVTAPSTLKNYPKGYRTTALGHLGSTHFIIINKGEEGTVPIVARVDPYNVIPESNERDNNYVLQYKLPG